MTPIIEARGLSAGYGGPAAIRDLDLVVEPGEVVALLGPNGAGKTTALRAIAGVLQPSAGEIRWDDVPTRRPLHRRARNGLAYVPEERSVFMGLTVAENLRIGPGTRQDALELFPELTEQMSRQAGLLSGGQQQMLTLARALASQPRALLADELSLGLAPLVVKRLLAAVRAAADRGVGTLLVEQHVRQALSVADRVYVLQRGKVAIAGPAAEVAGQLDEIERTYLAGIEIEGD